VPVPAIAQSTISVELPAEAESLISAPLNPKVQLPTVETTQVRNGVIQPRTGAPEGTQYKCLNVDEWKTVLIISTEYSGLYQWRLQMHGVVSGMLFIIQQTDALVQNYELQLTVYRQDREYLQLRLEQTINAVGKSERNYKIEKIALWGVILVQAAGIVILSVKSATR
jgi:hypothetical protein